MLPNSFSALFFLLLGPGLLLAQPDGKAIYQQHCASCHGDQGEGVDDEYDEALIGTKSVASLAKYIHRWMPEFEEDLVEDEDAEAVAAYIHGAFYSPEAQARLQPVRKSLLRLTQHQHRNAIADLAASFTWRRNDEGKRGLAADYFSFSEGTDVRKKEKILERIDTHIGFDLATSDPIEGLNEEEFSIEWRGSLMPPETGTYHFRLRTPNGARLFLNHIHGDHPALLDGWVSSNNEMQEHVGEAYLLGGYPVSLRIDFLSFQEKISSLTVEWKPPHGTWEPLPMRHLWPEHTGEVLIVTTPFPADDASMGYERGSSLSQTWQNATARTAMEAFRLLEDDLPRLAKVEQNDPKEGEKLQGFCHQFAERAFCRPLDEEQKQRYVDQFFAKHGPKEAARRSLLLTLSSPYFLYPELNAQEDSHQVARRLALALWDSLPDNHLRKKADAGHLTSPEQVAREAERMLRDPRARQKVSRFFHHWLALSEREDLGKDEATFPGFDEPLIADLRVSLELFLDEVIWSESSDYRKLFTTSDLYLNQRLAGYYGSEVSASGFTRVAAPGGSRAGIFTHPYLLAAFSYRHQTSPIHRGVYLSRNVLGRFLKPPPEAIEFKDADFDPTLTMREKVTELTKEASCMSCHEIINPVGFSLEHFDAVGRYRQLDNGRPIDSKSDYPTPEGKVIPVTGPQDLAKMAVESPTAHRAFIQHLFHHLHHQPVAAYGPDTMDQLHEDFVKGDFHIQKLLQAIALKGSLPQ
ncbi:DUF1592 domain-containing protein [Roseibacillus ishigakijimensis]|uniref:DUF1592 domain-containing protein n=1 Tax=Roseibacillus ishigakijimensis TaxID=454146 RepID=A0A934VGW6_9BACT|nr:DUF1592 domain-containing protein [Roseibacillus ishigakijimensis]MBK1833313.1 DUF1592 domain-containing protein [Roseibacillus ishigakijimensis]